MVYFKKVWHHGLVKAEVMVHLLCGIDTVLDRISWAGYIS